jgi:hypothetical protein
MVAYGVALGAVSTIKHSHPSRGWRLRESVPACTDSAAPARAKAQAKSPIEPDGGTLEHLDELAGRSMRTLGGPPWDSSGDDPRGFLVVEIVGSRRYAEENTIIHLHWHPSIHPSQQHETVVLEVEVHI